MWHKDLTLQRPSYVGLWILFLCCEFIGSGNYGVCRSVVVLRLTDTNSLREATTALLHNARVINLVHYYMDALLLMCCKEDHHGRTFILPFFH